MFGCCAEGLIVHWSTLLYLGNWAGNGLKRLMDGSGMDWALGEYLDRAMMAGMSGTRRFFWKHGTHGGLNCF